MLLCLCPVGCLNLEKVNWDSQQGRDLAISGHNNKKFQSGQFYTYIIRKVWYHQIWIQNYFGSIMSGIIYILINLTLTIWNCYKMDQKRSVLTELNQK